MKKAIVLLSGGLDSTTCLAIAQNQGFHCYGLSFAYGQKHTVELRAANRIAAHMGVENQVFPLDIGQFGKFAFDNGYSSIPITYLPARNTIFLAVALGYAETLGAGDIFIGVSSTDFARYPDCRPEFIQQFQQLAIIGTKTGLEGNPIHIQAPLQFLTKAQTIETGHQLGVDFTLTVSCYKANMAGEACGECIGCMNRQRGFMEAGIADPTIYYKECV